MCGGVECVCVLPNSVVRGSGVFRIGVCRCRGGGGQVFNEVGRIKRKKENVHTWLCCGVGAGT